VPAPGGGARATHTPAKFLPIAYDEETHFFVGASWLRRWKNKLRTLVKRNRRTELKFWRRGSGWIRSTMCSRRAERAGRLLQQLALHARREAGINLPFSATTPYQNTIPSRQQPPFPGSQEMERRIKSLVRWNAMAMVVRANKLQEGIGGHISTFASAATLYEVAFNHFFQASTESGDRDIVYFQGHAAPGIYARAYLEGRIPREKLENFRRELKPGGGFRRIRIRG